VDFLNSMMGGGRRQDEYRDFVGRYEKGAPYDRISDEEAASRYKETTSNMSDDEYRRSAREAFERMSPQERMEFGRLLQQQAREKGHGDFVDRDHDGQDDRFQDPDYMAGMMGNMHSRQPDMLGQLMGGLMGGSGTHGSGTHGSGTHGSGTHGSGTRGGAGGGMMSSPVAKAAMAGIAAMAAKRMMGGGR
jgi:hypothetical protein